MDPDPKTAGGVRIAGLGGLWQAVVLGFGGVDLAGEVPCIDPRLPPQWPSLSFRFCWRGRQIKTRISVASFEATLLSGEAMDILVRGKTHQLAPGATVQVPL